MKAKALISYFGRGSKSSMLESIERAIPTLEGIVTGWLKSKIQPVVCRKDHLSDRSKVSREIPGATPSRDSRRSAAPVFSGREPAPDYSTAIEARRRAARPIWRSLYGFCLLRLQSLLSVKATGSGLETLKTYRRAPASIGGLFMLVTWQSLLLPFYGVLLSGSRKAIRFLYGGVSNLIATPAPRLETESGTFGKTHIGGFYYA